jgi:hypothetical protein
MDIETAEAVDSLRSDIRQVDRKVTRVDTSLTAEIARVETSLTARIELVEASLTTKIEHVEASLTTKIEHVEASLTAKMDEHKRHADVQRESMHDDIRLVAENLASLIIDVRSLRR